MSIILNILISLALVCGKPVADLVGDVPQLANFTTTEYNVYSGFVPLPNTQKTLHYLLVESQNNWETDPLIYWTNGGPGCSSMLGFAQEHGPFRNVEGTTDFVPNPYSWNRNASVLYVEQPAGVGYSYCGAGKSSDECKFDDNTSAADNLAFVIEWFKLFPEYRTHKTFYTGESYAGIYVPLLSHQISLYNDNVTTTAAMKLPLEGMLVGNGCTNWTFDTMPATLEEAFPKALMGQQLHDKMVAGMCDYTNLQFPAQPQPTAVCNAYLEEFLTLIKDIDIYNLYLPASASPIGQCRKGISKQNKLGLIGYLQSLYQTPTDKETSQMTNKYDNASWYQPYLKRAQRKAGLCGEDQLQANWITDYFNSSITRAALHIPNRTPFQDWTMCQNDIQYTILEQGSQFVWENDKGKYRMLKFSGDKDGSVPTIGSTNWINAMVENTNRSTIVDWAPWYHRDEGTGYNNTQVGGFLWQLDGMDFSTVHGAGHMVPQDQPALATQLLFNWMNDKPIDPGPTPA